MIKEDLTLKFTIMVLNGITPVGKHLNLNLDFESFMTSDIINQQYDLPNLIISDKPYDNKIIYNGKEVQVKSNIASYLKRQIRHKSDNDFFGLFGTEDTLEFCSDLGLEGDTVEIYYNVKKKSIKSVSTDFLFIIDNETSQISNEALINQILEKVQAADKFLITTNSDLFTMPNCNVELMDVDL